METDKILAQIFNKNKPSLRQMVRQAIADLPTQQQRIARDRFHDINYCVNTLRKHYQFSERDAIAGTIAAIDFSNPEFMLDFKAIASSAPKKYIANPLPNP